jgi:putative ABC transport system permease protein
VGTQGVAIAFSPSVSLTISGLIVAVVVGVLAGLVPALQAARADILSSLRQV